MKYNGRTTYWKKYIKRKYKPVPFMPFGPTILCLFGYHIDHSALDTLILLWIISTVLFALKNLPTNQFKFHIVNINIVCLS